MDRELESRLTPVAERLIDQTNCHPIVAPQQPASGFWFGGGNMTRDESGSLWLTGRYRNHGDSRTGLGKGQRGLELALFRSTDNGNTFEKFIHFSKSDLNVADREVLSIEGTAIRFDPNGVELFLSTEKSAIGYPRGLESYLKPGTGVWTIDRKRASDVSGLREAETETILETDDPQFIHLKDPFLGTHLGQDVLMFCSHPFCWTSSNTGYVPLSSVENHEGGSSHKDAVYEFFPRGFAWDVAITRGTSQLRLPSVGALQGRQVDLMFYDGGECVRNLNEHASAVRRPRGYSCEELGGVAFCEDGDLQTLQRLSVVAPMFISPHGTGCSRYVDVFFDGEDYYATWQQAQDDGSQPLVMNKVAAGEIERLLTD